MAKPELLSQESISMAELKERLRLIKERDGELNFRANKTEEYLNHVSALDSENAAELKKKLENLKLSRLKEDQIIKLVDLLPKTVEEVKVILQGYTISVPKEDMKKIAEIIKGFVPEEKRA